MKLLSVQLARATWLMDVSEMNPRGKNIFHDLIPAIIEDYEFKIFPKEGDDFKDGMKFSQGVFVNSKGDSLQVGVTLWSDGIGADTYSSTTDSEEFLADILETVPSLGYSYDPAMIRGKTYASQIFVRCAKSLVALNPKLEEFSKRISAEVGRSSFGLSAIEFWPDQTQAIKPTNFSFQKRIGDPFSDDRYWSQSALPTDKHLELLRELEEILS